MSEIIIMDIVAHNGVAQTTLRFATQGYVTGPADTPANTYYDGRVKQPGNIQRNIFDNRTTFGASKVGYGEVVIVNNDGALDALVGYGFAGFPITIKRGVLARNASVPTWTTVFAGTMDSADFTWSEISIKVRDRQQDLTKPIQQTRYGGTNALPNGLDGVATDLRGKGKPILFGRVLNISPPLVNTSRFEYQISDGLIQSVDGVYSNGVALTAGAAYTSQADMEANAPAAGQYRYWLSAGGSYIRLAAASSGTLTVDATQGANVAARTPAQLMSQAMQKGGILSADISAADVAALDAVAPYECGYWVDSSDDTTGGQVLDALANSAGAWWGVDRFGKFRMGQVSAPTSGASIGTLQAVDIITIDRGRAADAGAGVPAWQVQLQYQRVFTVQNNLAGTAGVAYTSDRGQEFRTVLANDATVKAQWPISVEVVLQTHLMNLADANTEAARRFGLYKVRRDTLLIRCRLDDALAAAIDLGKVVTVQVARYGMGGGKPFLITGIRTDLRNNIFDLTLWG